MPRGRKLTPADIAHMRSFRRTYTVEERFWAKVNKGGPLFDGVPCWLWSAGPTRRSDCRGASGPLCALVMQ